MRTELRETIIYIHKEDLPQYKKNGSIVRNNYFWSLKSISCYSPVDGDWEYDEEIWVALARMLMFFTNSGYLGYQETVLEFAEDTLIPDILRSVSTRL